MLSLCKIVIFFKYLREMCRSIKLDRLQRLFVMLDNLVNSIYSRVKDIAIESETVRSSLVVGWDCAAESVQVDHLVAVVELKNVSDGLDSLQVLIVPRIKVVKRLSAGGVPVRQREVNSKGQINLTATEDILEEGVLSLDLQV